MALKASGAQIKKRKVTKCSCLILMLWNIKILNNLKREIEIKGCYHLAELFNLLAPKSEAAPLLLIHCCLLGMWCVWCESCSLSTLLFNVFFKGSNNVSDCVQANERQKKKVLLSFYYGRFQVFLMDCEPIAQYCIWNCSLEKTISWEVKVQNQHKPVCMCNTIKPSQSSQKVCILCFTG